MKNATRFVLLGLISIISVIFVICANYKLADATIRRSEPTRPTQNQQQIFQNHSYNTHHDDTGFIYNELGDGKQNLNEHNSVNDDQGLATSDAGFPVSFTGDEADEKHTEIHGRLLFMAEKDIRGKDDDEKHTEIHGGFLFTGDRDISTEDNIDADFGDDQTVIPESRSAELDDSEALVELEKNGPLRRKVLQEKLNGWTGHTIFNYAHEDVRPIRGSEYTEDLKHDKRIKQIHGYKRLFANYKYPNSDFTGMYTRTNKQPLKIKHIKMCFGTLNNINVDMKKCIHYKNCRVVDAECSHKLISADAVVMKEKAVIEGGNLPSQQAGQVFILYNNEPDNSTPNNPIKPISKQTSNNFFNWTMTYRVDSDIPVLAGSIVPNNLQNRGYFAEMEMPGTYRNVRIHNMYAQEIEEMGLTGNKRKKYQQIFNSKKYGILLIKRCTKDPEITKLYSELEKVTMVQRIDMCGQFTKLCNGSKETQCLENYAKKYMFYVDLERCTDYLSNTMFMLFGMDIITVVRGSRGFNDHFPINTFIDAEKYSSMVQLIAYLQSVSTDSKLYTDVLKRKDMYTVVSKGHQTQLAMCNLCYRLNNLQNYQKSSISNYKQRRKDTCAT